MMQNVLERDPRLRLPRLRAAHASRQRAPSRDAPDGDYWSKPNRETIFECVYELMHEAMPRKFPGDFCRAAHVSHVGGKSHSTALPSGG